MANDQGAALILTHLVARTWHARLLAGSVLATLACMGLRPDASEQQLHVIELEPYFRELRSVAVGAGGEQRRFLFDTGGGQTIISPDLARDLDCEIHGRSVGFRMDGEKVEFQECTGARLRIGNYDAGYRSVAVWDVGAVLPPELPPVDGVISLKSFEDRPVTLDLAGNQLTVETERSFHQRVADMSSVPIQVSTGQDGSGIVVYIRAEVGGRPIWLQFDSGNILGVQISPEVLDLIEPPVVQQENDLGETVASVPLSIHGLEDSTVLARVRPLIIDGALSFDYMRRWIFTLDLRDRTMWARPKGSGDD